MAPSGVFCSISMMAHGLRQAALAVIWFCSFLASAGTPLWGAATNVLTNPGFESDASGQNAGLLAWQIVGQNSSNETGAGSAHGGVNYYKVYQAFNGVPNTNGIYQDTISGAGAVYAAGAWIYTSASDVLAGQNSGWVEVSFHNAAGAVLALYRSTMVNTNLIARGLFPKSTWVYLPVTNQYNPVTLALTNTTASLAAPAGTSYVRYQIVFQGDAYYSTGSLYFDDLSLARTAGNPYGNWNIVWSDEFNGTNLNPAVWTYETGAGGWGNSELE